MKKRNFIGLLVLILIFGILAAGCATGGEIVFKNDLKNVSVTVGISVFSMAGEGSDTDGKTIKPGKTIKKSLKEDGYFAVVAHYAKDLVPHALRKSGELTRGRKIIIKASDF